MSEKGHEVYVIQIKFDDNDKFKKILCIYAAVLI